MFTDQQGIVLNRANQEGADLYCKLLDEFTTFKNDALTTMDAAIEANPEFAMPYFAKAYMNLFMTEPGFRDIAVSTMTDLRTNTDIDKMNDIERAHLSAVDSWIAGDLKAAAAILDRMGIEHPREVLGFRVGHEVDFFTGDSRNLRDRTARHLLSWDDTDHHVGIVYGSYAFGLEEMGHYERGEEMGLRGLEKDPTDVWALHAVAHTYEMRGKIGEGIHFMNARRKDWVENNLFVAHNWWHKALYHVDQGDYESALKIYEEILYNDDSFKIALVLLDAASLLWRIHLEGYDVKDRFAPLATSWMEVLPEKPFYVFNEMHATMAQVGAGRLEDAAKIVKRMEEYVAGGDDNRNNYANARHVGLPICEAILAFGKGEYEWSAKLLYGVRGRANEFGGSAAQRDVLDRTLMEAALRGNVEGLAMAMSSERVHVKPMSPYNWSKAAQALRLKGNSERAVDAEVRSKRLVEAAVAAAS